MPKRIAFFAFVLGSLALAACGYNNNNGLFLGPTPGPIATPTIDATATTSLVTVTVGGIPQAGIAVNLSTPDPSGRPGAVIASQATNVQGQATFTGLTGTQPYCFQSTFTGNPTANVFSVCTAQWAFGVTLGN